MTQLRVLHQGEGYVAVEKPPGLLVIPGRGEESGPSAREFLEAQLGQKVFVVHRLDKDTSGVLLFALEAAAHRTLSMAFEAGRVEKHYLALAVGNLAEPLDVKTPLAPARRGRMRPAKPGEDGKAALTLLRPLEHFGLATLVDAQPLTGRTHQIRVHLLSVGHPLLVDPQYGGRPKELSERDLGGGSDAVVLTRTPLHATRVTLPALEGIRAVTLESPAPDEMAAALALLRSQTARPR